MIMSDHKAGGQNQMKHMIMDEQMNETKKMIMVELMKQMITVE